MAHSATHDAGATGAHVPWYRVLYIQVLIAIVLGVLLGWYSPKTGVSLKWLGDAFIALIKMLIAPIIFCTIVHGIASIGDLKKVGRVGLKALIYFEVVSSIALLIGIIVGEVIQPGAGFGADVSKLDAKAVEGYASKAAADSTVAHILAIIPKSFFDAFATGDLLQVLLIAILTGVVLTGMGEKGASITRGIDAAGQVFFRIIGLVVKLAPIGAFGAMAFTVGQYGIGKVIDLAWLVGTFYTTSLLFIFVVLGGIAAFAGFSIVKFLAYIKDELLIVLGTSSSETVLPHMMTKMKRLGASDSVVGLVIPTGYSFNLDGTNIYMTLTTLFLAQAVGADLSVGQYATIFLVAMLTSKGASGVTGAGFITLAATLAAIPGNPVPVAAMTLVLGVDKFMSECRALTNLIGNGVATIVVSRWEGELDKKKLAEVMAHPVAIGTEISDEAPEGPGEDAPPPAPKAVAAQ
ncbi:MULTISPECIES: dicarboxylate/amino acid:cation symporter [Methylorubrum]|jgi:aerobic C4-dicarboxylate transport protein|uniref:C4-dicarboxylate transport protein n=3 Tax=Methylorubrum TaxID=2282523 RepID=A0A177J8B4_9HYPH|nr:MULTISPECIES: dicarboxylate/amino acid:cation symporter [Methylorubrum]ACB80441.1 sodium:dicarboxylate symporter [Methylorubrum populi BJ001]KAB7784296.1 C4-dicarboxylate transport protein [Methylorubrum populi]MBA8911626.1 aerobic C4-dicarboxylate transport protein [Methylorubrum thiocyanatum]OAH37432.1 sodium:dicarboxylate symporter [Methylorubrum populi]PZP70812.1 MAG: dicarboxylate/amino acid:cation symporter [Methylorubrum populi]